MVTRTATTSRLFCAPPVMLILMPSSTPLRRPVPILCRKLLLSGTSPSSHTRALTATCSSLRTIMGCSMARRTVPILATGRHWRICRRLEWSLSRCLFSKTDFVYHAGQQLRDVKEEIEWCKMNGFWHRIRSTQTDSGADGCIQIEQGSV